MIHIFSSIIKLYINKKLHSMSALLCNTNLYTMGTHHCFCNLYTCMINIFIMITNAFHSFTTNLKHLASSSGVKLIIISVYSPLDANEKCESTMNVVSSCTINFTPVSVREIVCYLYNC